MDTKVLDSVGVMLALTIAMSFFFYLALVMRLMLKHQRTSESTAFRDSVIRNSYTAVGLPACALGAFAIVFLFNARFGSTSSDEATVLKIFSLEFTGPGGPTTLWVLCYLSIVLSIRVLRDVRVKTPQT